MPGLERHNGGVPSRSLLASPSIEVHGHRGARGLFPENSIPGFRHAIRAGVDFIELDVLVTADNVPVVWHDPVLTHRKCQGPRRRVMVRELTLAQLKQYSTGGRVDLRFPQQRRLPGLKIATLDEVLALAPLGHFRFNIEIKSPSTRKMSALPAKLQAGVIAQAIRNHKLEERVRVQSFDGRMLQAVREAAPELPAVILHTGLPVRFSTIARRAKAEAVGPYFRLVTRRRVQEAHDAGVSVIPWTANRPRQWLRLIRAGVDGIITDYPERLIGALKEWSLR